MDATWIQFLAGPAGAAVALLVVVYMLISGKLHSHSEFSRLLKENEELKKALDDERKVANEAVQTGSVTNRLIGALVEVSSEHRYEGKEKGHLALPSPDPFPGNNAGDAEM